MKLTMWRGEEVKRATRERGADALRKGAEHILTESNDRIPLEYGDLMRSGDVDVDAGELVASISYDTAYAVVQHEDVDLIHPNGREAKFLERTLNDEGPAVQDFMAAELRKAF